MRASHLVSLRGDVGQKHGTPRRTIDFQTLNNTQKRETHHAQSPIHQKHSMPHGMKTTVSGMGTIAYLFEKLSTGSTQEYPPYITERLLMGCKESYQTNKVAGFEVTSSVSTLVMFCLWTKAMVMLRRSFNLITLFSGQA